MGPTVEKVFEGTWEELMARREEFADLRLKLIGYRKAPSEQLDAVIQELFAEADRLEAHPGEASADPHEATFGEIVAEKLKRQGLKA